MASKVKGDLIINSLMISSVTPIEASEQQDLPVPVPKAKAHHARKRNQSSIICGWNLPLGLWIPDGATGTSTEQSYQRFEC
jgi:hypothetical protein